MPHAPLDYHSPTTPSADIHGTLAPAIVFVIVVLIVNGLLLASAASDRSWGAIGIAIMIGPATNGGLLALSLISLPILKLCGVRSSTRNCVFVSVLITILAIAFDLVAIFSMDLHGC